MTKWRCDICGQVFVGTDESTCPRCGSLDETAVDLLREARERIGVGTDFRDRIDAFLKRIGR